MDWNRRNVLAAGLAINAVPVLAWAVPLGPALWEVRKGSAKVFLFGDGGPRRTPWSSARVEAALRASAILWKEVPANGGLWSALMLLGTGIDLFAPLSTRLAPKELRRVTAAAANTGVAFAKLEFCKPWLAAELLRDAFYQRNGFKDTNSAGARLRTIANSAGKPLRTEFPDMSAVIAYASSFSDVASVQSLLTVVDEIEAGAGAVERSDNAWSLGDDSLQMAEIGRLRRSYPEFYREALVARNHRWPPRIRAMLDGGRTTFVLVGDDHLVGPDSIQTQLRAAEMTATRVQ